MKQVALVLPFMHMWCTEIGSWYCLYLAWYTAQAMYSTLVLRTDYPERGIKAIKFPMWVPQYVQLLHCFKNCWHFLQCTYCTPFHRAPDVEAEPVYMFLKAVERNSV